MSIKRLLRISRPRFWFYTFGPYLVGAIAGSTTGYDLLDPAVIMFGLFFLFPANLVIYGVNDIFDFQTDKRNRKKRKYEVLVKPDEHKELWTRIAAVCIPFAALIPFTPARAWLSILLFFFFGVCYSMPPIRAKEKPFLDSMFNILYLFPGLVSYSILTEAEVSPWAFLAGMCWVMAMHAFSALPDIPADEASGVNTIATQIGFNNTVNFCMAMFGASALIAIPLLTWMSVILGLIYVALMLLAQRTEDDEELMRVYRWFPIINTLSGAAIVIYILIDKEWLKDLTSHL